MGSPFFFQLEPGDGGTGGRQTQHSFFVMAGARGAENPTFPCRVLNGHARGGSTGSRNTRKELVRNALQQRPGKVGKAAPIASRACAHGQGARWA
jgi:hypothetical protein